MQTACSIHPSRVAREKRTTTIDVVLGTITVSRIDIELILIRPGFSHLAGAPPGTARYRGKVTRQS